MRTLDEPHPSMEIEILGRGPETGSLASTQGSHVEADARAPEPNGVGEQVIRRTEPSVGEARREAEGAYGALIGEAAMRGLSIVPAADGAEIPAEAGSGIVIEEGRWGGAAAVAGAALSDASGTTAPANASASAAADAVAAGTPVPGAPAAGTSAEGAELGVVGWFQLGLSRTLTASTLSLLSQCAHAACADVGPFAFRGLAIRLASRFVDYDHEASAYIAERLPVHGPSAVRTVEVTLSGPGATSVPNAASGPDEASARSAAFTPGVASGQDDAAPEADAASNADDTAPHATSVPNDAAFEAGVGDSNAGEFAHPAARQVGEHASLETILEAACGLLATLTEQAWRARPEVLSVESAGAQVVGRLRVPHWSPSLAAFLCSLMLSADEAGVLGEVRVSLADAEARPRT